MLIALLKYRLEQFFFEKKMHPFILNDIDVVDEIGSESYLNLRLSISLWALSRERPGNCLKERNAKCIKPKYLCRYRPDRNIGQDKTWNKKD